jgi:DNA-binding protein WhiA
MTQTTAPEAPKVSFSANVKGELCRLHLQKKCCALAECYGILLYCNTFTGREVKIVTESRALAARLPKLFQKAFGIEFDEDPDSLDRHGKLIYAIHEPEKIEKIFAAYGYSAANHVALHVNLGVLEEPCCQVSFLRGAFLAGGSVTDPEKRYHLELLTAHRAVSRETYALMLELGYQPKDTERAGSYILYFKQSDAIEDFLTQLGAPVCAMGIMEAKVEKDLRNGINRRVNCETANIEKVVNAAQEQLEAIRRLEAAGQVETLPVKLQETVRLRMENPEATLSELAAMPDPPITKSAMNHRMRKLLELAKTVG